MKHSNNHSNKPSRSDYIGPRKTPAEIKANFMARFSYTYLPADIKWEVSNLDIANVTERLAADRDGNDIDILLFMIGVIGEQKFKGARIPEEHEEMLLLIHAVLRKALVKSTKESA